MSRWGVAVVVILGVVVGLAVYLRTHESRPTAEQARRLSAVGCRAAQAAFAVHASGRWLTVHATVSRLLPDSDGRYRHQRFIVRCRSGQTLLIVNDISIGQRVPVARGDAVTVRGQYVWDAEGGLIHFTHHDPAGGTGGWILRHGRVYAVGSSGAAVDNCPDKEVDNAPALCIGGA
ncbi:MAG TPA: DUF3465 domain-containing protein [Chloroflexota bacterium]|nr:DUF3465 domain-containing protein [Chloroflexota bacterium]